MTYCCSNHRVPKLGRNKRLKRLWKPCKIWMCVCDCEEWYMHWTHSTLRKCINLNRKKSKVVKLRYSRTVALSHSILNNTCIFLYYLILRTTEEIAIPTIDKMLFDECLITMNHYFWPHIYS